MVILNELHKLGLFGGCRFRGWRLAMSFSAATAAGNQVLELPQILCSTSSIVGEIQLKLGQCHSVKPWLQTGLPSHRTDGHSAVALLDQAAPLSPCEKGIEQILEFRGPSSSACHDNTSKRWTFPKISELASQASTLEHPSDRSGSPGKSKELDADQGLKTSRRDEIARPNRGRRYTNSASPGLFSGQKVLDGIHIAKCAGSDNWKEVAIVTKQTRKKGVKSSCTVFERPVKICSSSGKSKQAREGVSDSRQEPSCPIHLYKINRQISVLIEAGYLDEAYAVYEQILPVFCKPDTYTYVQLIKGFCEAGELVDARELFKAMVAEQGLPCGGAAPIVYNVMIHGLGAAGFVNEALNLLQEMTEGGFLPDVYTYNSIIHSLGKVGKVNDALTVFESMATNCCSPDIVSYNSLICSLGKAGRVMEAFSLYQRMIERGCPPDLFTFNTLLPILGKSGEVDLAISLYNFMKLAGCRPDVYTYTSLVAGLCRAGRVDEALLVSVEMTERGCPPNTVTFNSWLDGLSKEGRVLEAHVLFHKMLVLGYVPDNITYCILIDAFCRTGKFVDESFNLLKDLLKSTATLDQRTSEIVFQSFKKVGMLKQAKRIARNARTKQSRFSGLHFRD